MRATIIFPILLILALGVIGLNSYSTHNMCPIPGESCFFHHVLGLQKPIQTVLITIIFLVLFLATFIKLSDKSVLDKDKFFYYNFEFIDKLVLSFRKFLDWFSLCEKRDPHITISGV